MLDLAGEALDRGRNTGGVGVGPGIAGEGLFEGLGLLVGGRDGDVAIAGRGLFTPADGRLGLLGRRGGLVLVESGPELVELGLAPPVGLGELGPEAVVGLLFGPGRLLLGPA